MYSRRQFFLAGLAGAAALRSFDARAIGRLIQNDIYDLSIVRGADIPANVKAAVDAIGGMSAFVKPGDTVLLKPNMSFANPPEWGSTTHPEVIRTAAAMCAAAGAKRVIVVEYPMSRAQLCFERSGMTALAADCRDFTFLELKEESQFETVPVHGGIEVNELAIPKILGKCDVFINLPTAKAHSATDVSFGLKNLMGLFWDRRRFHKPLNLHEAIADLASILRPQLTIMDATWLLLTNGPQGPGKVEHARTIIAGAAPLAVDAASCGLGQWNGRATAPAQVRHLARAEERGLGSLDLSKLRIFRNT